MHNKVAEKSVGTKKKKERRSKKNFGEWDSEPHEMVRKKNKLRKLMADKKGDKRKR